MRVPRSMLCVDTNVLVYAHRADLPEHADYRPLLERLANDDEPLGLPDDRSTARMRPARLRAGERHWVLFRQLANHIGARGNDIPDTYVAAYAVENNATWLSADRGFARFNRLRWSHPMDL